MGTSSENGHFTQTSQKTEQPTFLHSTYVVFPGRNPWAHLYIYILPYSTNVSEFPIPAGVSSLRKVVTLFHGSGLRGPEKA